jgi:hypothetical protein
LLLLASGSHACTDSRPVDPPPSPSVEDSGAATLRINEVFVSSALPAPGGPSSGWLEIVNAGETGARLYDYALTLEDVVWELPDYYLEPGALYAFRARATQDRPAAALDFLSHTPSNVAIVRRRDREPVDSTALPKQLQDESFARYPDGVGRFSVYPRSSASESRPNPDLGFISKLASAAEFRPRDSSTNAVVRYAGFFWILGGWSEFEFDDWHSEADVWKSQDGVRWTLVSSDPPYDPYNSFVTWRDRIWSIGPTSFSSTDGAHWQPEPLVARSGNRSIVFNDALFSVDGAAVLMTEDGETWTELTWSAPWGEERGQPLVTVYRDKLWVVGGFSGYGEWNEVLHNDVWSSADGVHWDLVTPSATWLPRVWQSLHTYDDKIFMLNGANWNEWPEEYGNTAEVWFTEDGVDWFELPAELRWGARHASLSVLDDDGGLLLFGGYGTGGYDRLYNDAWLLRASLFFPKPLGDLRDLSTWGKHLDGSGPSPLSFSADNQVFMLRNRDYFALDATWSVTGASSRIIVGDGNAATPVRLELADEQPRTLYLHANSTTVVHGVRPALPFRHLDATLIE